MTKLKELLICCTNPRKYVNITDIAGCIARQLEENPPGVGIHMAVSDSRHNNDSVLTLLSKAQHEMDNNAINTLLLNGFDPRRKIGTSVDYVYRANHLLTAFIDHYPTYVQGALVSDGSNINTLFFFVMTEKVCH